MQILFPGSDTATNLAITEDEAQRYLSVDLIDRTRLGNYVAIYNQLTGVIEAAFTDSSQTWVGYLCDEDFDHFTGLLRTTDSPWGRPIVAIQCGCKPLATSSV